MGIATQIAKELAGNVGVAGEFIGYPSANPTVEIAVFYGDGNYERFATLGKTASSQHIQIKIRGDRYADLEYAASGVADKMQRLGHIQIAGIIGLDDIKVNDVIKKQIALEYKALIR